MTYLLIINEAISALCFCSAYIRRPQEFDSLFLLMDVFSFHSEISFTVYAIVCCKDQRLGCINNFTQPFVACILQKTIFQADCAIKKPQGRKKSLICLNECVFSVFFFSPQKDLLAHSTQTYRRQREFVYYNISTDTKDGETELKQMAAWMTETLAKLHFLEWRTVTEPWRWLLREKKGEIITEQQ